MTRWRKRARRGRPRSRVAPLAAGVVVAVGFGTAASVAGAADGWSSPTTLSAPGVRANRPQVAMNQAGSMVAAWETVNAAGESGGGAQAVLGVAGGSFTTPFNLPAGVSAGPIAMDGVGRVMWVTAGSRVTAIGGGLAAPAALSAGKSTVAQIAMNEAGDTVVVWVDCCDRARTILRAAVRPAGGTFSGSISLGSAIYNRESLQPRVAIDKAGAATIAWTRRVGGNYVVTASVRGASGTFSKPINIARGRRDGPGPAPAVAMNDAGDTTIVWLGSTVTDRKRGARKSIVRIVSRRRASGRFSRPKDVGTTPKSYHFDGPRPPVVAMDGRGTAVIAWFHPRLKRQSPKLAAEYFNPVRVVVRRPSGRLSRPVDLRRRNIEPQNLRISMNASGAATIGWEAIAADGTGGAVWAATRRAGGRFTAPVKISRFFAERRTGPELAMDKAGNAIAVWGGEVSRPGEEIVQAAIRPAN